MESKQVIFRGPYQFWIMSYENRMISLKILFIQTSTKLLISEEYSYQNFQKNISVAKIFIDCLCICSVDMSEFGGKDALCGSSCLGLSMSVMYMSFRVLLSFVFFFFFGSLEILLTMTSMLQISQSVLSLSYVSLQRHSVL